MNILYLYFILAVFLINGPFTSAQTVQPLESHFVPENHPNYKNVDFESCGVSLTRRIVGGSEADVGMFPWMTAIGHELRLGVLAFFCGGSIVNSYYVLTAAHCLVGGNIRKNKLLLVAGIKKKSDIRKRPAQWRKASRVIVHPLYGHGEMFDDAGDIALIEAQEPFLLNMAVSPICLPTKKVDLGGKLAIVAGWGTTKYGGGGPASHALKYLVKEIYEEDKCDAYTKLNGQGQLLCAHGRRNGSACSGDSGGPLMVKGMVADRPRFVVHGLLSFGPKYCGAPAPDFYTSVYHYLEFLLDNIEKA